MPRQPNILLIMDDQHRYDFLGAEQPAVATPHLDALAAAGTRFTHCCVNAPVCAPSRISLATGLHPWRLGCLDNHCYLPARVPTYYQRLRDGGYQVASVGKLDLAKPTGFNGRQGRRACNFRWGFTDPLEAEGKMHAGRAAEPVGPYGHQLQKAGLWDAFRQDYAARSQAGWIKGASHDSALPEAWHSDSWIGQQAVRWLDSAARDEPWHLFVSFVGPHDPFDPPAAWADRYRDRAMPPPIQDAREDKPAWIRRRRLGLSDAEVAWTRRQYCANVSLIDHWIGQMRAALAARGLAENTYILFASDHGEMLGDHGLYTKSVAYEGALRVPLIVTGPDLPQGQFCASLAELADLNPTICELAGLPYAGSELNALDARSLLPSVRDVAVGHRRNVLAQLRNFAALRTETHKLIVNYNEAPELYDLAADPSETQNRAAQQPELAAALASELRARALEGAGRR